MGSRLLIASLFAFFSLPALAQTAPGMPPPPRTWVDKDTGHRIWRISNEPNSGGFYFNVNAYTPDGKQMVYTAPDGIHVLDLATRQTKLLVRNPPLPAGVENDPRARFMYGVHAMVVGHKTNSVFYTEMDPQTHVVSVYKANTNTGKIRKLIDLPKGHMVVTVNADETLAAGGYIVGGPRGAAYGAAMPGAQSHPDNRVASAKQGPHFQPFNKGQMMEQRWASHLPMVLFTIRLEPGPNGEKPGTIKILLHSTAWLNHFLFSPTDPQLLMYCHEGPWQKVNRIWTIHTDGTDNMMIHHRTMAMEIFGHEFWGLDGETLWYDWQYPKSEVFFLASYNLKTHVRTAYHTSRDAWGIHFNLTRDLSLFCDDGGDPGQVAHANDGEWIELLHPEMIPLDGAINSPDFWQPGVLRAEHLVNMAHQYYREEPNVRFSPDKKMVFFTSNMFGPSYLFGVEVAKAANPPASEVKSTPDLARQWNPKSPLTTSGEPQPGH
jgi:oligogalacturonide lyase